MTKDISFIGDVLDDLAAFCRKNGLHQLCDQIVEAQMIFELEKAEVDARREIRTAALGAVVVDAGVRRTH